jgi:hypothetical protein
MTECFRSIVLALAALAAASHRMLARASRAVRFAGLALATIARVASAQEQLSLVDEFETDIHGGLLVTVFESALDELRELPAAFVTDFPSSPTEELALELRRTEPVADGAILTFSGGSSQALAVPDELAYFVGQVVGEPGSSVLLIVSGNSIRGFVARGGEVIRFRPDSSRGSGGGAGHVVASEASTDPPIPDEEFVCPVESPQPAVGGTGALDRSGFLNVPLAIEVTPEVVDAFSTNEELIEYVISLVAVASIPYQRDLTDELTGVEGVSLRLAHLNIMLASENRLCDGLIVGETHCSSSGEFCFRDADCPLGETCLSPDFLRRAQCFRDHWFMNFPSELFPRAFALQLWRAPATGAGGYCLHLSTLCSDEYSYVWAIVRADPTRAFLPRFPEDPFFASIMTHEISHLFGAVHPECLDPPPPLEVCRNDDTSSETCWRGATADTPGGSTVMVTSGCSALASPLTFVPPGQVIVPGLGLNPFPDTRMARIVRAHAEAATECVLECGGTDTDGDSVLDDCDLDDDNDGALDGVDVDPSNPDVCGDKDADACDDCAIGTDDFAPDNDRRPYDDGPDADCDGSCDASDTSLSCVGDCNLDCNVYVDEIVTLIAVALGIRPVSDCVAADHNGDDCVTVDECVRSVLLAMQGCSGEA